MSEQWQAPEPAPAVSDRFPVGAEPGWRPDPTVPGMLRLWDGRHWGEETRWLGAPEQTTGPVVRDNGSLRVLAVIAQAAIAVYLLGTAAMALWLLQSSAFFEKLILRPQTLTEEETTSLLKVLLPLELLVALGGLLAAAFFLVWLGQAYTDRHTDPRGLRRGTGMAILCWFLPVVSLWMPVQTMNDLWHASKPAGGRSSRTTPPSILGWWSLYLLGPVGSAALQIRGAMVSHRPEDAVEWAVVGAVFSLACLLVSGVLLIVVITGVTDHLRGRVPAHGSAVHQPAATLAR